jgi:hypothetical protein
MSHQVAGLNEKALYYFTLAGMSTIFFIVFTQQSVSDLIQPFIPSPSYRYAAIVLLFFIVTYLFDRFIENWREDNRVNV